MKVFTTTLGEIGNQLSLRLDSKYRETWDNEKGDPIKKTSLNKIKVADLINRLPIKRVKKGELEDECNLLSISETEAKYGRLVNSIQPVTSVGSDKTILNEAEIIVSKLVMSKGYIFTNEESSTDLIGSTELIPYKKRKKDIDLTFIRHLLLLDDYLKYYSGLETGKTPSQKRVNPIDFLQLLVPNVPYDIQKEIGTKIRKLENEMDELKKEIQNRNKIINEILATEFNIDFQEVLDIKKPTTYKKDLLSINNSFDLRFSYKFNAQKYKKLLSKIAQHKVSPLKDFINEPIRLGSSISPSDYDDDNGEAIYISMSSIKNWTLDKDGSRRVSEEYFEKNKVANSIKKGDIIIARSGEGTIGKVALIEDDIDAIFADFTMRVRISNSHNPKYFYYYFCSDLFQLIVEKEKKGLGNNTNFFPNQLKRFPIIQVSLNQQNEIVKKIEEKLEKVRQAEMALVSKKLEIDNLIRKAIV
ncbi:hypothetical protein [Metabacillus iocasae]|uniref:Restriction endonuclease S subunit n=1 Tax=Priestia iocasae TaxID=2291674 RepID=A0ABS2QUJ0_9BACI|nr:hypothetical protein [Metabacillus iocasae]MBM7702858.1 restriction endonuclease S subunit [Metabacillus iocasae]